MNDFMDDLSYKYSAKITLRKITKLFTYTGIVIIYHFLTMLFLFVITMLKIYFIYIFN